MNNSEKTNQLSSDINQNVEHYSRVLANKGLPVIFSLKHFSLILSTHYNNIFYICASNRNSNYREFRLRKNTGGYRLINTPHPFLKSIQDIILKYILYKVSSHKSSHGFDTGESIKKNAEVHLNQKAILKIDLLRFYDSINEVRVYNLFHDLGYHSNLAVYFAKLCTIVPTKSMLDSFKLNDKPIKDKFNREKKQGILPQGAPTSPKIANLICKPLDEKLHRLALENNLKYSRYADDITFSGENKDSLYNVKEKIIQIIEDECFFINKKKTKIIIKGNKYFVTGLCVQNSVVTVSSKTKKEIFRHLYFCLKYGVKSHLAHEKIENYNFHDWLKGKIAFIYSIEKNVGEDMFEKFNKIVWFI